MATPGAQTRSASIIRTIADLLERLGGIPPDRIWFRPAPGTAVENEVIAAERRENRLSAGKTVREMARKVEEYFAAGVRCVWLVDGNVRNVGVHAPARPPQVLGAREILDAGEALPGFLLLLERLFAELDCNGAAGPG